MNYEDCITALKETFPFREYLEPGIASGMYENIFRMAKKHCTPGGLIFDIGCGPMDKTAILQLAGFRCFGCDDLQDEWHKIPENKGKILHFAETMGINFKVSNDDSLPFQNEKFDMIMLHDVLEHLHSSPKSLLENSLDMLKPGGCLFITVPNAVNIRKRIGVLFGKSNMPAYETFYHYKGPWRGHVREYVKDDLKQLSRYLGLETVELKGCDHMTYKLHPLLKPAYKAVTFIFNSWKDTLCFIGKKRGIKSD